MMAESAGSVWCQEEKAKGDVTTAANRLREAVEEVEPLNLEGGVLQKDTQTQQKGV